MCRRRCGRLRSFSSTLSVAPTRLVPIFRIFRFAPKTECARCVVNASSLDRATNLSLVLKCSRFHTIDITADRGGRYPSRSVVMRTFKHVPPSAVGELWPRAFRCLVLLARPTHLIRKHLPIGSTPRINFRPRSTVHQQKKPKIHTLGFC